MKLGTLNINNVQAIRTLCIDLSAAPVTLIAGENFVGKTTVGDAIRMAMRGETPRVNLKKNYNQMVRDGAKKGTVSLTADDGITRTFDLPTGKWSENEANSMTALTLDMHKTASLDGATLRKVIFKLTNTTPTPEAIAKRMIDLGCESGKVALVKPMLLASVEDAYKEARRQAATLRGNWEYETGEKYGSEKANDWIAERPEVDEAALAAKQQELSELEDLLDFNKKQYTLIEADITRETANAEKRRIFGDLPAKQKRIQDKLAVDEKALAEWTAKLEQMKAAADGITKPPTKYCPCCKSELYEHGPAKLLMEWHDTGKTVDISATQRLKDYENSGNLLKSVVANDKRDLDQCIKDIGALEAMPKPVNLEDLNANLSAVKQRITSIAADKGKVSAEITELNAQVQAAATATTRTGKAASLHAEICAWAKVEEHLKPDGVVSEFLSKALKQVNAVLKQMSDDSTWPVVVITPDMSITFGGRLYTLCSESEIWRCDAMLTATIASMSGLRMFMLDRMDCLHPGPSRIQLYEWLDILAYERACIDTCIVMATLKVMPERLPETFQCFWLADGEVANELKAAA
jgi:phage host-nuclease inhibitor protein Gam